MKVSQLPLGRIAFVTLHLSTGEEVKARNADVVVGQYGEQHIIIKQSPARSFGHGTLVSKYRLGKK